MAVRLGNVLWWMGLSLGGVVWTALLALARSAGPIDEAVFWASLIAALPIGFGYLCRYVLSGKIGATADTVLDPGALPQAQNATTESGARSRIKRGTVPNSAGECSGFHGTRFSAKRRRCGKGSRRRKASVSFQIAAEVKVSGRQNQKRNPFQR